MKFAFDVDGVITDAPDFFRIICKSLKSSGHEIHIVSDYDEHFRNQRIKELEILGIEYDHFEITANKEEYCRLESINFVVDDNLNDYFPNSAGVPVSILEIKK